MIIKKYLAKEIYMHLAVVSGILVLIFLSNQLVQFLGRAAAGKLTGGMLLKIMALEVPILLGFLLPVALFIAILLAYGRLYVDSEMTVLQACGVSQKQLLAYTQTFAILVFIIVLIMNFYLTPNLYRDKDKIIATNPATIIINTLVPGRFKSFNDQNIIYVEGVDHTTQQAQNIFIAKREFVTVHKKVDGQDTTTKVPTWRVLSAEKAYQVQSKALQGSFVVAENGTEYNGIPGQRDFRVIHFKKYGARIPDTENIKTKVNYSSLSFGDLWGLAFNNKKAMAELQWRISMPLSVPILVLLALPLSRVNPRLGRYRKLIPAILLYTVYANMQFVARGWLEDGVIPAYIGLWFLHFVLLAIALSLYVDKYQWRQWSQRLQFWNKAT
ncbi:MAG: LPS export ABC transporter permease LptF [Gammaproteobacteria bacterium]|nr:LPS export ABC transporter permease LptF [Gammaproteobacteria bacterium]